MFFQDWRVCDTSVVHMDLNKDYLYYFHAKAWGFKGLIGGTHSWMTFWSSGHQKWLVIEITDAETIHVQDAEVVYSHSSAWQEQAVFISDRSPLQRWFGATPKIIARQRHYYNLEDFKSIVDQYPIKKFVLYTRNCNTFSSYLIAKLNLNFSRPFRSVGFRSRKWWCKKYRALIY